MREIALRLRVDVAYTTERKEFLNFDKKKKKTSTTTWLFKLSKADQSLHCSKSQEEEEEGE